MCMNRVTVPVIECMAASSGDSFARPGTHWRHSSMVAGSPSGSEHVGAHLEDRAATCPAVMGCMNGNDA